LGEGVPLQGSKQPRWRKGALLRQAVGERFGVLEPLGLSLPPFDSPLIGTMFARNAQFVSFHNYCDWSESLRPPSQLLRQTKQLIEQLLLRP
jgi:hypothetical protein